MSEDIMPGKSSGKVIRTLLREKEQLQTRITALEAEIRRLEREQIDLIQQLNNFNKEKPNELL